MSITVLKCLEVSLHFVEVVENLQISHCYKEIDRNISTNFYKIRVLPVIAKLSFQLSTKDQRR